MREVGSFADTSKYIDGVAARGRTFTGGEVDEESRDRLVDQNRVVWVVERVYHLGESSGVVGIQREGTVSDGSSEAVEEFLVFFPGDSK